MAIYKLRLKDRKEVAAGTMAFHFEKPAGFNFVAGQAGDFTLEHPPEDDAEGNKRSFSLASAPYEDDLFFTTRMRSTAFKRSLQSIPIGTELTFDGPWGELTLDDHEKTPVVFITGGIGITPVRSMILQSTREKLPRKLLLFYSNRRPEDAAFMNDLIQAEKENAHFHFVATMTEMKESSQPWSGETSPIDESMLKRYVDDLTAPVYYVSGPPGLVSAMQKMLTDAGVTKQNIRAEEFSGY